LVLAPTIENTGSFALTVAAGGRYVGPGTIVAHDGQCAAPYVTLNDAWRSTSTGGSADDSGHPMADHSMSLSCGSSPTGVGRGRWYRFVGPGGDALPLTFPGTQHCGTLYPGWLSGWDASVGPCKSGSPPCTTAPGNWEDEPRNTGVVWGAPDNYDTPGDYPETVEGVVDRLVCFGDGPNGACSYQAPVNVVRCAGFLLWRLPYVPTGQAGGGACRRAYCTAPSGL
jgi:hypothetical protein